MTSAPPRRDGRWGVGLFLAALLVRAVHLLTVRDAPLFRHLFIDPAMYDAWGWRIAGGRLLADAPFFLDPLYPYFVGAVYAVAGRSQLAVATVQALLGAAVPVLVHAAARPWTGRATARVAGVLAVGYPVAVYYGALLLTPALAMPLCAALLWLLSRALDGGQRRHWIAAGAALGLTCLTRGNLLLVVPVLIAWAAIERGRSALGAGARATSVAGGCALVLALPLAHNLTTGGEWILTTTNWGQIFFIGNNPGNPSGRFNELPFVRSTPQHEQEDFKREAERRAGRPLTHGETSALWFREGWRWVAANPGAWLRVTANKLRVFWGAWETPASHDYYLFRRQAPLLRLPLPAFGLLGPLALVGWVLAWRRGAWPRLLALLIAAGTLAVVPFFVLTRFRMVLVPALYALAALAAVELVRAGRDAVRGGAGDGAADRAGRRWRAATLGAGWLAAFALVNLPVRGPADTWSYRVARALGAPVRLETTASGRFNLGVTYAARASGAEEAEHWLRLATGELRASLAEEQRAATWIELGKVLARRGDNDGAIEAYRRASHLQPGDVIPHHAIGLLERRAGRLDAAAAAFARALALQPAHLASALRLGEVRLEQGRPAGAAEAYRHALRLAPGHRAAGAGLAEAERRLGRPVRDGG